MRATAGRIKTATGRKRRPAGRRRYRAAAQATEAGEGMRYVLDPTSLFIDQAFRGAAFEASRTVDLAFLYLFFLLMVVGLAVLQPGLLGLWVYASLIVLVPLLTPGGWSPLMSLPHALRARRVPALFRPRLFRPRLFRPL